MKRSLPTILIVASLCFPIAVMVIGLNKLSQKQDSRLVLKLRHASDNMVSWMEAGEIKHASNPHGAIMIGDAGSYYGMHDLHAYFKFTLREPLASVNIKRAWLMVHCSCNWNSAPTLWITSVDAADGTVLDWEPRILPLCTAAVPWVGDENYWKWKQHSEYSSPDLTPLLVEHFSKYPRSCEITIVVGCSEDNVDRFQGICSFDNEPGYAARLIIERFK